VNARIAATAGQNTIRDASYLAKYRQDTGIGPIAPSIESPTIPGPWQEGYIFPENVTSESLLSGLIETTGSLSTRLTEGYLLSHLPLGGIELSSQKLFFNEIDSVIGRTTQAGDYIFGTTSKLEAIPLLGQFDQPTFKVLEQGANVANGSLGIAFNDVGVSGKFDGVTVSNTLDALGKGVFYGQTALQTLDLADSIAGDIERSGFALSSLTTETKLQAGQTALDIGFGYIGTTGVPGAVISLGYTYRHELLDASRVSHQNQVREMQFNLDNNLPPRIGPRF
jgi:hypothetical protein